MYYWRCNSSWCKFGGKCLYVRCRKQKFRLIMHIRNDRWIIHNSQVLPLLFQSAGIFFFFGQSCFPIVVHLYVVLKTIHFNPPAICASLWFAFTIRGFIKQIFIVLYGASLWFGIINVASTFINLRYLLTTKLRSTMETTFWKEEKSEPSLKKKTQLQITTTQQQRSRFYLNLNRKHVSVSHLFLLNDSIDDSYHLGFLSTRKFNILFFIKTWNS